MEIVGIRGPGYTASRVITGAAWADRPRWYQGVRADAVATSPREGPASAGRFAAARAGRWCACIPRGAPLFKKCRNCIASSNAGHALFLSGPALRARGKFSPTDLRGRTRCSHLRRARTCRVLDMCWDPRHKTANGHGRCSQGGRGLYISFCLPCPLTRQLHWYSPSAQEQIPRESPSVMSNGHPWHSQPACPFVPSLQGVFKSATANCTEIGQIIPRLSDHRAPQPVQQHDLINSCWERHKPVYRTLAPYLGRGARRTCRCPGHPASWGSNRLPRDARPRPQLCSNPHPCRRHLALTLRRRSAQHCRRPGRWTEPSRAAMTSR